MDRSKILEQLKEYFIIQELVSPDVYHRYGEEMCWRFFSTRFLCTLLWLREYFDVPMHINTWAFNKCPYDKKYTQRGLRENTCQIVSDKTYDKVPYLSGHVLAEAADAFFVGLDPVKIRKELSELPPHELPPFPIRFERNLNGKPISWVHFDLLANLDGDLIQFLDIN